MRRSRNLRFSGWARSWNMRNWYSPGGTLGIENLPVAGVTAYQGVGSTAMMALIVE